MKNIEYFRDKAEEFTASIVKKNRNIKTVLFTGSIPREILGIVKPGEAIHKDSDIDLLIITNEETVKFSHNLIEETSDMPEVHIKYYSLKAIEEELSSDPVYYDKLAYWIINSLPLYDPDNLFADIKKRFGVWNIRAKKVALKLLWNSCEGELSNVKYFLEKKNIDYATWALRITLNKLIDMDLIIDNIYRFSARTDCIFLKSDLKQLLIEVNNKELDEENTNKYLNKMEVILNSLKNKIISLYGVKLIQK